EAWQRRGLQPDYTPFFLEALVASLAAVPQANAAFEAEARAIRRYPAVHLGLSVASADGSGARHGAVHEAETHGLPGLALAGEAVRRSESAGPDTLAEATVTLTDFGPGSALFAVPPVLPGQSIALRVGAVEERLLARDRGFFLAPSAYLCLSVDHRTLDGA